MLRIQRGPHPSPPLSCPCVELLINESLAGVWWWWEGGTQTDREPRDEGKRNKAKQEDSLAVAAMADGWEKRGPGEPASKAEQSGASPTVSNRRPAI
ncbi:hypothetical protein NHX12_033162 [Muraenolepis orangiensis]|uniref:Uncharacterized protein n=1 Tax=Muraenolepis orangiensis TaxID=630683 RepID=A0A9Q0IHQ5_9TELE|nr:hypothetical protein NHX12_033162 [Muraenolepis orangiensis]